MNDKIKELLKECDDAYDHMNFEKLIALCDEVLEMEPDNLNAIGYKGYAYYGLWKYDEALEILERGVRLYPDNYYLNNNLAMVYYELGEYEKSLKCCDDGLKIKKFDWLIENKIKALIKLNRKDEAWKFFKESDPEDKYLIEYFIEDEII